MGCFRRDFVLSFPSDIPSPSGCTVSALSADGTQVVAPGPGQGDGGRRYAIVASVPSIDWTATQRWGVQVWLRSHLSVGASPTPWVPDAAHPARAVAASPVPVTPLSPPVHPGVPLGSTLDAQGCSHVRVQWSLPAGGAVRTSTVWEVSETALRTAAGLSPGALETEPPGVRLAALWVAYDAMKDTPRRAAFRRIMAVDGATRSVDVTLPKGSMDIHLFTVTTQTMTGVESPWPGAGSGDAHLHLQAAIAPRLRHPAPPLARAEINTDATVTVRLMSASAIPVERFLVFATRSEAAARDRESMGPPVASVPVTAAPTATDPVTKSPIYEANWTGALAESWDPWLIRAVAKPVDTLPVHGVRGVMSAASEITSVLLPPTTPPDLDVLTAELWDPDHRGVVVRSSTSAPVRVTASGEHRLGGSAGTVVLPATTLAAYGDSALTSPPGGAATAPVVERGARAAGRTPLALWFKRPVATDPVDVTLRLLDPAGRVTERSLTVPGWVAPPSFTVTIAFMTARPGGVLLGVDSDASAAAAAGVVMNVRALKRAKLGGGPGGGLGGRLSAGIGPGIGHGIGHGIEQGIGHGIGEVPGGGAGWRPAIDRIRWPLVTVAEADFALSTIPFGFPFFPSDGAIHVVRVRKPFARSRFAVWVPVTVPLTVVITLTDVDGHAATARESI